jgi:ABC-type branched-subunit amino acid transport system substrate-binding protein
VSVSPAYRIWFWLTRTTLRKVTSSVVALVLAAGITAGALSLDNSLNECGAGFYRGSAHECVGVTDGSYDFFAGLPGVPAAARQQMSAVLADIRALNSHLTGQYATIALLLPMTSADTPPIETVHAVEGAYLAQAWADSPADPRGPRIRLLLANPGTDSDQWQPVVDQLAGLAGTPGNLLAVTGISVSTGQTQAEVGRLTSQSIPVVGGAIVADDLANSAAADPYPGLARVEPTNSQEAQALARYLASQDISKQSAVLVEDVANFDDPAKRDLYNYTLARQFQADTAYEPEQFSSLSANVTNDIADRVLSICDQPGIKYVYFAGRQAYLTDFLNELHRGCQSRPFTVVTGSAASHLVNDPNLNQADFAGPDKLTLDYVPIAAPLTWSNPADARTYGFMTSWYQTEFAPAFTRAFQVSGAQLDRALADGQAMINYDAALTAVSAIQDATGGSVGMPSPSDIAQYWPTLKGSRTVQGATGLICLDNLGNPYDKAIPIVQYSTTGVPQPAGDPIFLGAPPTGTNCQIAQGG